LVSTLNIKLSIQIVKFPWYLNLRESQYLMTGALVFVVLRRLKGILGMFTVYDWFFLVGRSLGWALKPSENLMIIFFMDLKPESRF
jgi:hypothetical protein